VNSRSWLSVNPVGPSFDASYSSDSEPEPFNRIPFAEFGMDSVRPFLSEAESFCVRVNRVGGKIVAERPLLVLHALLCGRKSDVLVYEDYPTAPRVCELIIAACP
jgi:hypothetical protein